MHILSDFGNSLSGILLEISRLLQTTFFLFCTCRPRTHAYGFMGRFGAEKFEVYHWKQARDAARAQDEDRAAAVRQQLAQMGFAVADTDDDLLRACDYDLQHVIECLVKVGAGAGRGAGRRRAGAARGARRQDHGRGARRAPRQRPEEAANVDAAEAIADEELAFPTRKHVYELTGLLHIRIHICTFICICICTCVSICTLHGYVCMYVTKQVRQTPARRR